MGREDDHTIEPAPDPSLSWKLQWWAGLGSILVFLAFLQYAQPVAQPALNPVVDGVTRGHRWIYFFSSLVIAGMAYVAIIAYLHGRGWSWSGQTSSERTKTNRFLCLSAPLVCAFVCWLLLVLTIPDARSLGRNYVGTYCAWGAVSERQFQECLNHVTIDQVHRLDTLAARFARGEHDPCGPGIYCYTAEELH